MENVSEFLARLTEGLELDDALTEASEISPGEWDSLQLMDAIALIDESFGVSIDLNRLGELRSIKDLFAAIEQEKAKG